MRNKLLISFLLSLLILMPLSLRSQETEIFADETLDNIYDMSIDELMNISVSVASKKDEKVKDAPGTVTVYNASLIRQLGYYTIKDLANITPGYSAMKTADVEYQLETRGTTASNNEKNLVLIDGMPVNHARNNKALCQEEIPLLFAQRVEFLRGPASALYGMGAFNGVINIIPKRLEEDGTQIETDFTVGLDESLTNDDGTVLFRKRFMANVLYKSGSVNFICSASYIANEASLETFNGQNYNKYRDNQEATFVYAKQTFDFGLGLGVLYMDRTNGYGTGWAAGSAEIDKPNKANFHRWQSVISFLQYKANLSNTIKLNSSAKFNIAREAGLQANKDWWNDYDLTDLDYAQMNGYLGVFNFDVTTNNLEALAEVSWDIFDSLGFIVGINYDIRWQQKSKAWTIESQTNTDYTQLYSKKAHIYSAYLQGRYMIKNFLEGMILTAGVRSDNGYHAGKTYYNLSPRFALVQKLTKEINIKAMYGSALKAPGQDAYSHNEEKAALVATDNGNGIIYSLDENLNPEVIHTNELAVTFDAEKISISVSGFYNITKDMLVKEKRVDAATTDIYFNKSGTVTALGGEFEIQAIPIKNLRLIGNYSYARVRDQDDKKIENTPSMKTNVITSYTAESLANLTAAVIVKWVKDYNTNSSTSTYHGGGVFLDMNVLLPLPYGLNLQFQALNIIGTKNTAPDGLTPMPGRTFNIGIHGKF